MPFRMVDLPAPRSKESAVQIAAIARTFGNVLWAGAVKIGSHIIRSTNE